jgi:exodeoxyribonuclease VII small subunit
MENEMTEESNQDELTYEQAFEELQTVIAQLEAGDKPLEETLALYERGQALYQRCTTLLDQAEIKVQQLNQDGSMDDFEAS